MSLAVTTMARGENTFDFVVEITGDKAAWGDYDNDGWVDLAVYRTLWHNEKGVLVEVPGLKGAGGIWGDFDRDGYLDFFSYGAETLHRNLHGQGFEAAPLPALGTLGSRGATTGDFNGDGHLDIYIGGYEAPGYQSDKLLTNNGDGTLSITWTQPIDCLTTVGQPRPARGVTSADWDNDGDLDIYVSNYRLEPNGLWRNDGSGTFTDVSATHNAAGTSGGFHGGHSIGAVWADFDNDGLMDLFVGNFAHPGQPQSRFLRNRGPDADYAFEDMGTGGIIYQESYASPVAGDIDNDGDLDLYFTTVYPVSSVGPNYPSLFRNDGNFKFVDVTTDWGLPKTGTVFTYQAAFADYDNDGFLDLATTGKLYRNTGGAHRWLKVRLKGGDGLDATAIGTRVLIRLSDQTLLRQVEGGVGEGNQNDPTLHFGLGTHTGPLKMEIQWPGRNVQVIDVGSVDQTLTISAPTLDAGP